MSNKEIVKLGDWKNNNFPVTVDGRLIKIDFSKVFGNKLEELNIPDIERFLIKKSSYQANLELVARYINYFIEFYDEDNELLMSYLKLKYIIDNKNKVHKVGVKLMKSYIYNILITPSVVEKIKKMTEDNYLLDIDSDKKIQTYSEDTRFTDLHARILLSASTAAKIMLPVTIHFLSTEGATFEMIKGIYSFFRPTLDLFAEDGVDMYTKLRVWIGKMVDANVMGNRNAWQDKAVIYDDVSNAKAISLFEKDIMVDTFYKYMYEPDFKKGKWVESNPIMLNNVVISSQLKFSNRTRYKYHITEISANTNGDEGELSGMDKLLMNASKIDETLIILAEENMSESIERMRSQLPFITDEEIDYYYRNCKITKLHQTLINYYYAKYFGGFVELNFAPKRQLITLLVMMKRRLMKDGFIYLPQLLSGNIEGKMSNRVIQNSKFLNKIETSPLYKVIMEEKYSIIIDLKKENNSIIGILSSLINSKFTFVDFDMQEVLGDPIMICQDTLSDEFINFIGII